MECYGRKHSQLPECRHCRLKRYCAGAADPPLLADRALPPAVNEKLLSSRQPSHRNRLQQQERDRRYSRADLLEVIGFMASLDATSIQLIDQKLQEPSLNLSSLAGLRGVSRQAMHKLVKRRLTAIPELEAIITYRRHKRQQAADPEQPPTAG